eukprot:6406424-Alexandrium_andersonii.AAC.1
MSRLPLLFVARATEWSTEVATHTHTLPGKTREGASCACASCGVTAEPQAVKTISILTLTTTKAFLQHAR